MGNEQSTTSEQNLTHKKRLALVFSNEKFDCGLEKREGNDVDIKNIKEVLLKLNFDVEVFKDLTVMEIAQFRKYYSALNYTDYDSFVLIVLTHGSSGGILYASDGKYYTHQIWNPFVKNKSMKDTHKIFIFQACRGKEEEMKIKCVEDLDGQTCTTIKDKDKTNMRIVPHVPHCLLAFSTFEDHVSKRNVKDGTLYINMLCRNLTTAMNEKANLDILDVLTMTNCDVMDYVTNTGTGQTPVFISFLHHTTFSTPNQGHNSAIDSSSELDVARETMRNDGLGSFSRATYKNNGHIFGRILYDSKFKKMAEKLRRTLQFHAQLEFECLEMEDARIRELLWPISDTVELKNVDCLVMIILAEMCEIRHQSHERIYVKISSKVSKQLDKIPINEFWQTFAASQCQYLRTKPKLFFFIDTLERCDMDEIQTAFSDPCNNNLNHTYQKINEHADFLWVYVYGKQMYEQLINKLCKSNDQELLKLITEAMREAEKNHTTGKCSYFESTLRYGAHLHPANDKHQKHTENKLQMQPLQIVKLLETETQHNTAAVNVDDLVQNSPEIEEWQTVKRGAKSKSTKRSPRNSHTQKNQFQNIAPHSNSEWIGSKYELNYVSGEILQDCKNQSVCYFVAADFEMKSEFAQKVQDKLQYNKSDLKRQGKKKSEVVVDHFGDSNYIFHLLNAEFCDDTPTMTDTKSCLRELKQKCIDLGVTQLAIPYTGNDGISWRFIQGVLRETFANSNIAVHVYNKPVADAPCPQSQKNIVVSKESPRNKLNSSQIGKSTTKQNTQKIKQSNKSSKKKKNKKIAK